MYFHLIYPLEKLVHCVWRYILRKFLNWAYALGKWNVPILNDISRVVCQKKYGRLNLHKAYDVRSLANAMAHNENN